MKKNPTKLAKVREVKGLTQRALAILANVGYVTIARIEMRTIDPRISTLKALANALDVKISELVD